MVYQPCLFVPLYRSHRVCLLATSLIPSSEPFPSRLFFLSPTPSYLFPEIARRRSAFLEANPEAKIISLGIGDTTQPIPPHILSGLVHGASKLGTPPGYSG